MGMIINLHNLIDYLKALGWTILAGGPVGWVFLWCIVDEPGVLIRDWTFCLPIVAMLLLSACGMVIANRTIQRHYSARD